MSLDGRFYHFLAKELDSELKNGRIQKIYQLTKTDFLLMIRANQRSLQLSLSLSTSLARIHLTKYTNEKPDNPSGFCMFLRKYLEGGTILNVQSIQSDRILQLSIENMNEIGDLTKYKVYLEVFGRYTNLIIATNDSIIIEAYKHISPFDDNERTIVKGALYEVPFSDKIDPIDEEKSFAYLSQNPEATFKDLIANFIGFSPLISKYIVNQARNLEISLLDSFQRAMAEPTNPIATIENDSQKYYYFDVFDEKTEKTYYTSLSDLIDAVYLETSKLERMKQLSKNIYQLAKREYEKNKNKLEKLTKELDAAKNSDIYRLKGDLIQQHLSEISKGDASFEGHDYVKDETVTVQLDRLLTPFQNANHYYKKYKKAKTAVAFIEEQISITKKQIIYFDILITQIENASITDLDEIKEELASKGYLRTKNSKSKKAVPNYDIFLTSDGTLIYVGKNNIQNEYLTHKLASSSDWWFHTKDFHGSHVIVKKQGELDEETIRMAANLASYFSKARLSSSVPVDYTLVKNVKKIPGEIGSLVQYSSQKTIYIDPDPIKISSYLKKKMANKKN